VPSSGGHHGHHAPDKPRPTPWPLHQAWAVSTGGTAFVLTGGGSLGAVQVGMMAALHERGIDRDLLVGTSVGAVNAAYVAGPGTTGQRLAALADLWAGMRRRDVFVADPGRWLRAAVGGSASFFSAAPLRLLLKNHLGYHAFEEARLRLYVTATDLVTGAALLLDSGPVVAAVTASAAVPGLLPPVRLGERTLVDGAVGHAGTLAHADAQGVADIYLLPAGYPCAGPPPVSALGAALTALSLLLHPQLIEEVRAYTGWARLHVLPPLCPLAASPADFSHADSLRLRAHATTREWLDHPSRHPVHQDGALALHARHRDDHPAPASRPVTRRGTLE
jgi:NTE family protein